MHGIFHKFTQLFYILTNEQQVHYTTLWHNYYLFACSIWHREGVVFYYFLQLFKMTFWVMAITVQLTPFPFIILWGPSCECFRYEAECLWQFRRNNNLMSRTRIWTLLRCRTENRIGCNWGSNPFTVMGACRWPSDSFSA